MSIAPLLRPALRRIPRRTLPLVVLGAAAALTAGMAPAVADTVPVTVTVINANSTGRTLALKSLDGTSSPNLSGTQSGFITAVTDSSYLNKGYTVSAVMSKLYRTNGGTFDCSTSIPSANVTIKEPGLIDLSGLSAATTPVLNLAGSAAGTSLPAGTTAVGIPQTLSQTALAGATGTVSAVGSNLPIQTVKGNATDQAFTQPAAAGSGTGCSDDGTGATIVPLMTGTANLTGVQSYLNGLIGSGKTTGALSSYLSSDAVRGAVTGVLSNVSSALLASDTLSGVTGSLNKINNLVQSGLYQTSPVVTVDTSSVPSGQYQGVMTVTLADNPTN